MANADLAIIIKAQDHASPTLQSVNTGLGGLAKGGAALGLGMAAVNGAIGLVGAAFGAAKGSIIDLNSSLEQSQVAFTTMLGSGEAASAFLKDLQKFAQATPFEFPDLVDASKKLMAMGFESQKVIPMMTAVGDAVAAVGGGKEMIDGVAMALGQMQSKGKVSAEEMGQLAERGIPAWDMLAKKLGVDIPTAMDMVSKGSVKAGTFMEAFQEGVATKFGGMMEKQAQTFAGAMSTISDALTMSTATAFKPFFEMISQGAIALAGFLTSDTFTAWAEGAAAAIELVMDGLVTLGELLSGDDVFIEGAEFLKTFFPEEAVDHVLNLLFNLGQAFRDVFSGDLSSAIENGLRVLEDFGGFIATMVEEWASAFASWVDGADSEQMSKLAEMSLRIQDWLLRTALVIIEKLADWAAAFVDWIAPKIPGMLMALGSFLASMLAWLGGTALPLIASKLLEWGAAFIEWVGPRIGPMLSELGSLLMALGGWILGTALPAIVSQLIAWGDAFTAWVFEVALPKLPGALLQIQAAIITWIAGAAGVVLSQAAQIGTSLVDGIANAITSTAGRIKTAAMNALQSALAAATGPGGIDAHSPSEKWWNEVGVPIGQGIIGGLLATAPALMKATTEMLKPPVQMVDSVMSLMGQKASAMAEAAHQAAKAASKAKSFSDFARVSDQLGQVFGHGKFTEIGNFPAFAPYPTIGPLPSPIFTPNYTNSGSGVVVNMYGDAYGFSSFSDQVTRAVEEANRRARG